MITRDALYTFIENLIANADPGDALYEAVSFRNVRGRMDQNEKTVRVECFAGFHNVPGVDGTKFSEVLVQSTVQCWVVPEHDEQEDRDVAADLSFEMSREIFTAIAGDPGLNGLVCDAKFDEFQTGDASVSGVLLGVTYLDGVINNSAN